MPLTSSIALAAATIHPASVAVPHPLQTQRMMREVEHALATDDYNDIYKLSPADLSLMADSGFQGLQNDAPERSIALPYKGSKAHPLTPEQKVHNALLSRIRIVVENTLAEMKHFRILAAVFRHPLDRYDRIFVSIAGVVTRRADQRLADQRLADQRRAALPLAA